MKFFTLPETLKSSEKLQILLVEHISATECVEEQVSDLEKQKEWLEKDSCVQNEVKLTISSVFMQKSPPNDRKMAGP